MKQIILLTGIITLLITSGCIMAEDGGGGHDRHDGPHAAVIVAPVPVVVAVPVVEIRHD